VWKYTKASVAGTSHHRVNRPCQDSCHVLITQYGGKPVLVVACADGAGTAEQSARGSHLACSSIADYVSKDLAEGLAPMEVDHDTLLSWYKRARGVIVELAAKESTDPRSFACTLIVAVVGEANAVFGQLGDGAAVVSKDERFLPIFWPQSGEYANTTNFLTDTNFDRHVEFARWDETITEFAIMTDGLQRLALDYSTRLGHQGFFRPLFRDLREVADPALLDGPLAEFLDCPRINQRTDDDKTLILATRLSPCAPLPDSL
jgi:hypothetical protein